MFSFDKLCKTLEELAPGERLLLLAEKAHSVSEGLGELGFGEGERLRTLSAFVVGSLVSDGGLDEKQYQNVYASLVEAFGGEYDFRTVKELYREAKDVDKTILKYTEQMMRLFAAADEGLQEDIVMLCLLLVSSDGHVSLREKRYIRKLCRS